MLFHAIGLALRQLTDRQTFVVMIKVALVTLVLIIGMGVGLWQALRAWLIPVARGWVGENEAAGIAAVLTALAIWFLFRAIAMGVAGLFTDEIVASVEEDHYPAAYARAVPVSFAKGLRLGLRSAGRAIGWNLLAAPFYIALLVSGIGTIILVIIVNAIILRRDLEDMVAARHPNLPESPMPRVRRWQLGVTSAIAFVIPVANLFAPVFSAALAVHMLHLNDKKEAITS
jgi:uncharacterized protein involved in cysteine biosynthesis